MSPLMYAKLAGCAAVLGAAGWLGYSVRGSEVAALKVKHAETLTGIANAAREAADKARKAEYAQAEAFNAVAQQYEKAKTDDVQAAKARVIDDVRSGRLRVRLCPNEVPGPAKVAASASEPNAATDSGTGLVAAAIGIGSACDAQVRALQAILRGEREQ